jgi:SPP1 gp7 family putative phage head morphogenesis protein
VIAAHRRAAAIAAPQVLANQFQNQVGTVLSRYFAAVDLLGRAHVMDAAHRKTGKQFKLATTTTIPNFDDLGFESVPFTRAIERVLNLIGMSRNAYDGLAQRYKMQAFTIAGISDVKLIEQIKSALADVMASGGTENDFQAAVNALTDNAGIARLAKTQIDTVFQTAVQTAYQNGRFEQMSDPAVVAALPYWTYRTAGDDRVRPAHAALDGFTARYGDPVWNRLYPPAGYNCRCTVTAEGPDDVPEDADTPGLGRIPLAAANVPDFAERWRAA